MKPTKTEVRTAEQLREDYEIERELASKLRSASRDERRLLYSSLYDELFQRVPLNPGLLRKSSPQEAKRAAEMQFKLAGRFLSDDTTFLEIGPGDCGLALKVAQHVKQVYAVDVSQEITRNLAKPENFQLVLSDGSSVPVAPKSVDVAYSDQLMEHLHPDDALTQLKSIYEALVPGGIYVCITPNRLSGPHDISKYFDTVATGLHLREYSTSELIGLFREVGFARFRLYIGAKGHYLRFPITPILLIENMLERLPPSVRRRLAGFLPIRLFLGVKLVGVKD